VSKESNFELFRRFGRTVSTGDLSSLDELLAPDFVGRKGREEFRGPDGWRQHVLDIRREFSGIESGVDEVLGDDGLVAERWWIRGRTKDGEDFHGRGITMHRIVNGRLQENWEIFQPES
jgi:ketosteroid isomerase-like protein